MKIIAIVLLMCLVALLVWFVFQIKKVRSDQWETDKRSPQWEVSEYTWGNGNTDVHLSLMARGGGQCKEFRQVAVGEVDFAKADWQLELELLRSKAKTLADALNEARNKETGS